MRGKRDHRPSTSAQLRPRLARVPVPGAARPMVTQAQVKGIRQLGEADIEVKIKGQDVGAAVRAGPPDGSQTMNGLAHFTKRLRLHGHDQARIPGPGGPRTRGGAGRVGGGCGQHGPRSLVQRRRWPRATATATTTTTSASMVPEEQIAVPPGHREPRR
ncbi:MAG: hypothetical protein MZV70_30135 [Desulfobacterales bacterium]|nr:hypothetical protein [Desulfobacterales bacterium]